MLRLKPWCLDDNQVAVVHPSHPSRSMNTGHGYREKDMPYKGWTPHCDGLFGAFIPP